MPLEENTNVENTPVEEVKPEDAVATPVEDTPVEETPVEEVATPAEEIATTEETPVVSEKTVEDLAAEEAELDLENPDATPNKYNLLVEKAEKEASELAKEIFDEVIVKSSLPFAFAELIVSKLTGLLSIHKGKSKLWDARCRADNKFHLTPIKDLEIYESIKEENEKSEDLGGEGTV